jgi:hypothetical protein
MLYQFWLTILGHSLARAPAKFSRSFEVRLLPYPELCPQFNLATSASDKVVPLGVFISVRSPTRSIVRTRITVTSNSYNLVAHSVSQLIEAQCPQTSIKFEVKLHNRARNTVYMDSGFDKLSTSCHICVCGRSFSQPGALSYHQRSCKKTKTRLAGALLKAKDAWAVRKRRRLEVSEDVGSTSVAEAHAVELEVHISLWLFSKLTWIRSALQCTGEYEIGRVSPEPPSATHAIEVLHSFC